LITGDETSKNNGRTSNKNMNKEAQARAGSSREEEEGGSIYKGGFNPGW
jgi:hypothetical protein